MLTIYDENGVDLVAIPPDPRIVDLTTPQGTQLPLLLVAVEDDTSLGERYVSGTIDWNDGNHVDDFSYVASFNGTLALISGQYLSPGEHNVSVYARNYRAPVPDEVTVNFKVTVVALNQDNTELRYLYGPILPKDDGYPNADQWNFNSDKDLAVLASSVKMLISTQIGERVMLPSYGTDIRALLFEPDIQGLELMIQDRLVQSLAIWEPRVAIASMDIVRNQNRSVTVNLLLVSRLTKQQFRASTTIQQ